MGGRGRSRAAAVACAGLLLPPLLLLLPGRQPGLQAACWPASASRVCRTAAAARPPRRGGAAASCARRGVARQPSIAVAAGGATALHAGAPPPLPSVSVQVATWNRPALLLEALAQIYSQDYLGDVEVVVVDDSYESSEASVKEFADAASLNVQYRFLPERASIGAKRNMAAAATSADIICTWDDDDIFTSDRISRQVHSLLVDEAKVCSYAESLYFFAFARNLLNIGLYRMDMPKENALCFWRSWFEDGPGFQDCSWKEGRPLYQRGASALSRSESWKPEKFVKSSAADLPVLCVKHPNSATGEVVKDTRVRCYDDPPLVDRAVLGLACALRQGRYPELPMPTYATVLQGARAALYKEIVQDIKRLRSADDPEAAEAYWRALGGGAGGTAPESFDEMLSSIEAMQREVLVG